MEATELKGAFVVEVGVRQAWPFLGFAWPDRETEGRLYIDTAFRIDGEELADGDPARAATALLALNSCNVTGVAVNDDAELTVRFDPPENNVLVVSGTGASFTTHDVWWLGSP